MTAIAIRPTASIRKLNLGSGVDDAEGFVTFDITARARPHVLGTAIRLPFADGAFGAVKAHHVLEHLRREDLIPTMNECWRVLTPGGELDVHVPVFPFPLAIADPTHLSFFASQTFDYFCCGEGHDDHMRLYGIQPWERVSLKRYADGAVINVLMRKVEP